jgi:hypothetical protein
MERTLRLVQETNLLVSGRELDDDGGPYDQQARLRAEAERAKADTARTSSHLWAAAMLARDLDTFVSILRRLPVLARNLDAVILRRALRGGPLPAAQAYIPITDEMLDAIVEAGPIECGTR